jgi:hypothetical protein
LTEVDPTVRPATIRRVVHIQLSRGALPAGAELLSWLVYPGTSPRDAQDREDAECAIGFEAARLAAGKNPSSGSIRLPLLYLRQTEAQRKKVLSKVHVRLNKRLAAARMTWPFLRQVVLKHQGLKTAPLRVRPESFSRITDLS